MENGKWKIGFEAKKGCDKMAQWEMSNDK